MADVSGNALEKAGGRAFLEGVKELRKAQAPLEVAAGRLLLLRLILYVTNANGICIFCPSTREQKCQV